MTTSQNRPSSPALKSKLLIPALCLVSGLNAAETRPPADNPLLTESTLPYHLPPFGEIKDEHFAPAYELGMAENLAEIAAIADNPEKPTFENTLVALERSGDLLDRTDRAFRVLTGSMTNPVLEKLESDLAPRLAAHSDAILLNPKLFARIRALYDHRATLGLDPESERLLERYHKDFIRAGARLDDAGKTRLKAFNAELASLSTQFSQNTLKEINASAIIVDQAADLAGLSDADIAAAKAGAPEGKYAIRLVNTTGQPPLALLTNRGVRERVMAASLARGSRGGEFDNRAIVARMVLLRAERAQLLGYPSHAAYQLEEQTAGNVETVNRLLAQLAPPAAANARREAADLQRIVDDEHGGFRVTACDWEMYAEKLRKARYDFDESKVRPYFELHRVLVDGVFFAASRLYGLTFKPRPDLHGYSPDMVVYEVFNQDGSPLALFLADFYARPSKRGGAWMDEYVSQSDLRGRKAVVANHLNIPRPPAGQPTLLTFDEVRTLFHEFGHALHGMFSDVKYPRFAGTNVPRDFVEFPSQVNEMWATWPEVVENYAKHHETGAPLPKALLGRIQAAAKFNQGYATTEYLAAALLDQAWHQLTPAGAPGADRVSSFEAAALAEHGVDFPPVPPRYRTTYFSHVFSGGYSAGYYSYIWSEVLDADTVGWMKSHGGLTRANGDRFRAMLLARGGSEDAMKLFRDFFGGEPDVAPLLERRGLDAAAPR